MSSFKLINPPSVHDAWPTYSHVQTTPISPTCTLVTIAGQVGVDAKTKDIPSSHTEQVKLALENLRECLKSVGATPKNLIKLNHYVVNLDPSDTSMSEILLDFMAGHRPPGTLVGVAALAHPKLLYEVEAMAIVQEESTL
ncbi:Endoribonuclease L-PSP/chorismate mutase-like protein [Aspergillus parasiticus]|uniref:Endoribonuclease L-PSP/chorismate mutase-like protein n=2 Tax=Aspergillus subgen. Circumdati TaxID=2720871 RepID=A0A5N6D470_ASPPA|nr:Endoribonuclease L-PSP/chorismate mutase-like protein [Aspergillus parasiticus]KAE8312659.1 Endoribonuclease L-PSP/chorismate mutase-like protein [Aspergillus transmontanensis]